MTTDPYAVLGHEDTAEDGLYCRCYLAHASYRSCAAPGTDTASA